MAIGLIAISDAFIVWFNSSDELKAKAWGHGTFGVVFTAWAAARALL